MTAPSRSDDNEAGRSYDQIEGDNNKALQTRQTPPFWDWSRREATRGAESSLGHASPDRDTSSAGLWMPERLAAWWPNGLAVACISHMVETICSYSMTP